MTDAPFMQLYVADYLGDTQHLTTEQHGAYLLLLMAMWRAGGYLPNDAAKLARIARVTPRRWHLLADDVLAFFESDGEQITQKRLLEERLKAASISEKRSVSGSAGGRAKALKNKEPLLANANEVPQHTRAGFQKSEPERKSELRSQRARDDDDWPDDFREQFWQRYQHKVGKADAIRSLERLRKRQVVGWGRLMSGLDCYIRSKPPDRQWCNPATWLNQGRWDDQPATPAKAQGHVPEDKSLSAAGDWWRERLAGQDSGTVPLLAIGGH